MRRSHVLDVIPGQQLVNVRLFVYSRNGCEDAGQIAMRFDPFEFTGLNQGRDSGPVLCGPHRDRRRARFTGQGNGTDRALDWIVMELDSAVIQEPAQAIPVFGDVFQGLSDG